MHHAQSAHGVGPVASRGVASSSPSIETNATHKVPWSPSKNISHSHHVNTNTNTKNSSSNTVGGNRRPMRPAASAKPDSQPSPSPAASLAAKLKTHWAALQEYLNAGDASSRSAVGRSVLSKPSWKRLAEEVLTTLSQLPFCLEEAVAYREELLPFLMAFAVAPIPNTSTQYAAISTLKQFLSTIAAVMEDTEKERDENDATFYGARSSGSINVSASRFLFDFLVIHHNALHAIEVALGVLFQDQQRISAAASDPHVRDSAKNMDAFARLCEEAQINRHLITELLEFLYVLLSVCPPAAAAALTYPELLELFAQLLLAASPPPSSSSLREVPTVEGKIQSKESLVRTTPVQVCYIAGLLHSMSVIPDAPEVLVAYRIHERILVYVRRALASVPIRPNKRKAEQGANNPSGERFRGHTSTAVPNTQVDSRHDDDVAVTSLCMMLRVAVKLSVCPSAYLPLYGKLSLAKLLHRLVSSSWGDLVELGCLWLTDLLQRQRGETRTQTAVKNASGDGKRVAPTASFTSNNGNSTKNNNKNTENSSGSDSPSGSDTSGNNSRSGLCETGVDCSTLLARAVLRRTPMCDALVCVLCLDGFYRYSAVAAACLRELAISCPDEVAQGMLRSIEAESERRQRPSVSVASRGVLCLLIEHADAFNAARKFLGVPRPAARKREPRKVRAHKVLRKKAVTVNQNGSRSSSESSGLLSVSSSSSASSSSSSCFSFEAREDIRPTARDSATCSTGTRDNALKRGSSALQQHGMDRVPEDLLARLLLVTETVFTVAVAFGLATNSEVSSNFEALYSNGARVPPTLRRVISSTACAVLQYVDDSYFTRFPSLVPRSSENRNGDAARGPNQHTVGAICSPAEWRALLHTCVQRLFPLDASTTQKALRGNEIPHRTSASPHHKMNNSSTISSDDHQHQRINELAANPPCSVEPRPSASQIPTTRSSRTHENTLHKGPRTYTVKGTVSRRDVLFHDASNVSYPRGSASKNRGRIAAGTSITHPNNNNSSSHTNVPGKPSQTSVPPILSEYAVVRSSELMGSTFYHDSIQSILELSHFYIHARSHRGAAANDGSPRGSHEKSKRKGRAFSRCSSTSTSDTHSRSSSVTSTASSALSSGVDEEMNDFTEASEHRFVSYRRSPRDWQKSSSQRRRGRGRSESSASNNSFVNPWASPKKSDNAIPRSWRVTDLLRQDVLLFAVPLLSVDRAECGQTSAPGVGGSVSVSTPGAAAVATLEATAPSAHLRAQLKEALAAVEHHTRNLGEILLMCPLKDVTRRCVLRDLYINVYPTLYFCLRFIVYHLTHNSEVYDRIIHSVRSTDAAPDALAVGEAHHTDSPVGLTSAPITMIHSGNAVDVYHTIGRVLEQMKHKEREEAGTRKQTA